MTTNQRAPFYRVTFQQGAAAVDAIVTGEVELQVFDLVANQGRPFAVWVERVAPGGPGAEMAYFDPATPGFRYTSRVAQAIPLDANGHPLPPGVLQPGQAPPGKVEPTDVKEYAKVVKPARLVIPPWQGQRTTHGMQREFVALVEEARRQAGVATELTHELRERMGSPEPDAAPLLKSPIPTNGAGAAIPTNGAGAPHLGAASMPGDDAPNGDT